MNPHIHKIIALAAIFLAPSCMGSQPQESPADVLLQPDMSESYYTGNMPVDPASAAMQQHIAYIESLMRDYVIAVQKSKTGVFI